MPQPTATIHDGSTSPVTAIHTGVKSPTSTSHVRDLKPTFVSHAGDLSPASASHVGDKQPTIACPPGGTNLVIASHTRQTSPTSASLIGDQLLATASHVGSMSLTIAIHVGAIDMIEKPRCIGCNPKFLCIIFKGDHLIRLCPSIAVVCESWSLSSGPSAFESSLVFQHSNPSLVDTSVVLMQSSVETTPILRSDAPRDHVVSHTIQLVVMPMQYWADTTHVFGE